VVFAVIYVHPLFGTWKGWVATPQPVLVGVLQQEPHATEALGSKLSALNPLPAPQQPVPPQDVPSRHVPQFPFVVFQTALGATEAGLELHVPKPGIDTPSAIGIIAGWHPIELFMQPVVPKLQQLLHAMVYQDW
tara:strand:- start:356 stop:757 length:402 start_codon:yes stop_codon:yes gene_type:complete